MYEFEGVSKIIIDNLNLPSNDIISLIKKEYSNIEIDKIKSDYYSFIEDLNELNINKNTILEIINSNSKEEIENASIEIINSCPFKCDHCYISRIKKSISFEKFKKMIDELVKLNCRELLITGGEPMLHENFIDIYLYAKKKGLMVTVNTNCFLLTDKILKVLSTFKPKAIEISIYGFDDDSYYNFTHQNHAFTTVDKNIEKLLSNGININLKTMLTKKNNNHIDKIKKYALNKRLPFRFDYIIFPNKDEQEKNSQRCTPQEIINVLKNDEDAVLLFKTMVKNIKKEVEKNNNIFQCSIGKSRLFIDSNLDIRPCLVVPFKVNYEDCDLNEAYNMFKDISKKYKYTNSKCKNCNKKSICRYCPGKFYMETGSFEKAPNFYCEVADKLIEEFS